MVFLPLVVRAEYREGYHIHVVFNDGVEGTLDFERWLRGPVFKPVREPGYFQRFFVDGGTVSWPNGADVAPETLYAAANAPLDRRQSGRNRPPVRVRRSPRRRK